MSHNPTTMNNVPHITPAKQLASTEDDYLSDPPLFATKTGTVPTLVINTKMDINNQMVMNKNTMTTSIVSSTKSSKSKVYKSAHSYTKPLTRSVTKATRVSLEARDFLPSPTKGFSSKGIGFASPESSPESDLSSCQSMWSIIIPFGKGKKNADEEKKKADVGLQKKLF